MILIGETLPCEHSGIDTGTIKATDEGIEIIFKKCHIFGKIFDLFITEIFL